MEQSSWERLVNSLIQSRILQSTSVIRAMRAVPRTDFLPEEMQSYSSTDTPLPIGFGQTISAPHMVSIMNEALQLEVGQKILEVGAGSGWHAATIAETIGPHDSPRSTWGHVYTVEIVRELAEFARRTIMKSGYGDRVTIVCADGSNGFAEKAPYDRILVTAAAPSIPKPLIQQLKLGGLMLIPVGDASLFQTLIKVTKLVDGKIHEKNLGGVAFVPLTGVHGQRP